MTSLGKMLIFAGVALIVVGSVLLLANKAHLPLGRLPGDMSYQGKNVSVFFPLGTSILLSVILSAVLWLLSRWR